MTRKSRQEAINKAQEAINLTISPEKVFFVIVKAREFAAKVQITDPDSGSNASDDLMADVLEDTRDDPVFEELTAFISSLSEDEQIDLVMLDWLGRDDCSIADWAAVRTEAARAHNANTAAYLLGMPLLSEFLDEALSMLGHSCEEYEMERL